MRSDEIRKEALSLYSHANVRDRYDADLMMAGFTDGAEWADAHPEPQGLAAYKTTKTEKGSER